MFSVTGWAVSADSLAQQTLGIIDPKPSQSESAGHVPKSKKRKRTQGDALASKKVSGDDLEKLWNKHFPSEAAIPNSATEPKDKKRRRERKRVEQIVDQKEDKPSTAQDVKRSPIRPKASPNSKEPPTKLKIKSSPNGEPSSQPVAPEKQQKDAGKEEFREKKKKERELNQKIDASLTTAQDTLASMAPLQPAPLPPANLTPLQAKMRNKLTSARFRHLNQTLYTSSSFAALELFTNSPDLFAEYHAGFSQQVKDSWPQNPVDVYIRSIKSRGQINNTPESSGLPLPRRKTGSCTITDLGCGDAPLARGCQSQIKALGLKFHNFDLHAPNTLVTKADISKLPLRDGEADIAVFCLSLMGTNWLSFVEEAWRILRGDGKGEVWVAEVKSRFGRPMKKSGVVENSIGKKRKQPKSETRGDDEQEILAEVDGADPGANETDISAFVEVFKRRGFVLKPESVTKRNKMFVSMVFVKSGLPVTGKHKGLKWNGKEYRKQHDGKMRFANDNDDEMDPEEEAKVLKPCVYKTR